MGKTLHIDALPDMATVEGRPCELNLKEILVASDGESLAYLPLLAAMALSVRDGNGVERCSTGMNEAETPRSGAGSLGLQLRGKAAHSPWRIPHRNAGGVPVR